MKKTLLIIEPARIIRNEIKKILARKEGRRVRLIGEMSSGIEGLAKEIAERPDVVRERHMNCVNSSSNIR